MDKQTPLKEKWQVVTNSFARQPDLTLEILTIARHYHKKYDEKECTTKEGAVRAFLCKYGSNGLLIKERGAFRRPTGDEVRKHFAGLNPTPVQQMTDGEIAAYLTRPGVLVALDAKLSGKKRDISTDLVKKMRQSLGVEVVKRSFIAIPVGQLTDAEFASYVESDSPVTPDVLNELRLLTPFIRVPTEGKKPTGTKKGFRCVPVNQLKHDTLIQAFKPARLAPGALKGLRLWDAFIRLPTGGLERKGVRNRKKPPL
jgi:hypothetical protein